jgi:hypothetical protein
MPDRFLIDTRSAATSRDSRLRFVWSRTSSPGVRVTGSNRFAAFGQAFSAAHIVVAANPWPVFVMLAQSRLMIEPQAAVLRFLASKQSREMEVDFVDQLLRQVGRAKRMRLGIVRPRGIQDNR